MMIKTLGRLALSPGRSPQPTRSTPAIERLTRAPDDRRHLHMRMGVLYGPTRRLGRISRVNQLLAGPVHAGRLRFSVTQANVTYWTLV
jgi:hypothetical protein